MKQFSHSLIILYSKIILLSIISDQSHITVFAASTPGDMGWLDSGAPGVAFGLHPDYGYIPSYNAWY